MLSLFPRNFINWWQMALLRLVIRGGNISRIHVLDLTETASVQIWAPDELLPPSPQEHLEACWELSNALQADLGTDWNR